MAEEIFVQIVDRFAVVVTDLEIIIDAVTVRGDCL